MISSYFEFVSSKSYVLDRSESIDMHIEVVLKKPNLLVSAKKQFFPYGRGGVQKVMDMSATIRVFFTPSLSKQS